MVGDGELNSRPSSSALSLVGYHQGLKGPAFIARPVGATIEVTMAMDEPTTLVADAKMFGEIN